MTSANPTRGFSITPAENPVLHTFELTPNFFFLPGEALSFSWKCFHRLKICMCEVSRLKWCCKKLWACVGHVEIKELRPSSWAESQESPVWNPLLNQSLPVGQHQQDSFERFDVLDLDTNMKCCVNKSQNMHAHCAGSEPCHRSSLAIVNKLYVFRVAEESCWCVQCNMSRSAGSACFFRDAAEAKAGMCVLTVCLTFSIAARADHIQKTFI